MVPVVNVTIRDNRNGNADKNPDVFKLNPRTSFKNFAKPVICRYRPQPLPKCAIFRAQNGTEVKIAEYGGIF